MGAATSPANTLASGAFTYAALWQVGRTIIDHNIIELVLTPTAYGAPIGIDFYDNFPGTHPAVAALASPSPSDVSAAEFRAGAFSRCRELARRRWPTGRAASDRPALSRHL